MFRHHRPRLIPFIPAIASTGTSAERGFVLTQQLCWP